MSNLSVKSKEVNIVIRKKSYPKDFEYNLKRYLVENCREYAYIKHDHDINLEGEVEDLHYHIVATFRGTRSDSGRCEGKRLSTYLNEIVSVCGFDSPFGIEVDKTKSKELSLQYLIHKNDELKTPHSIKEIVHNYPQTELETIINSSVVLYTLEFYANLVLHSTDYIQMALKLPKDVYKNDRMILLDFWKAKSNFLDRYSSTIEKVYNN